MNDLSLYEPIPPIDNNFQVKFRVYENTTLLPPHWHEHIEILYFTEGACDFICNGKQFPAVAGDLVVVNSTEIHSFVARGVAKYYCILIYPEFFADIRRIDTPIRNRIPPDARICELMQSLLREHTENGIGADMATKGIVYTLLCYLYRNCVYEGEAEGDRRARAAMLRRLAGVMEYISENYTERISTASLAESCYLTEAHFCRLFKRATGKTVTEYVSEYRVSRAAVLLRTTTDSVSAIASAVGFEDPSYFCRVFRTVTGMTPREYRLRG